MYDIVQMQFVIVYQSFQHDVFPDIAFINLYCNAISGEPDIII